MTAAARAAVERLVDDTTSSGVKPDVDVLVALAEAAGRLEARGAAPTLQAQLATAPSAVVRTAALRGLQAMKAGDMSALMQTALADKDPTVRRAALALLPGLPITSAAKASHLGSLIETGAVTEQQGALEVLGTLKSAESRALLATYLDDLEAGRLAPVLHIDLVDAVQTDGSPALQKRLDARQRTQKADALIKAFPRRGHHRRRCAQGPAGVQPEPARRMHALPRDSRPWRRCRAPSSRESASALTREQTPRGARQPEHAHRAGVRHRGRHAEERRPRRRHPEGGNRHRTRRARPARRWRRGAWRRPRLPSAPTRCRRCRRSAWSSSPATFAT